MGNAIISRQVTNQTKTCIHVHVPERTIRSTASSSLCSRRGTMSAPFARCSIFSLKVRNFRWTLAWCSSSASSSSAKRARRLPSGGGASFAFAALVVEFDEGAASCLLWVWIVRDLVALKKLGLHRNELRPAPEELYTLSRFESLFCRWKKFGRSERPCNTRRVMLECPNKQHVE